MEKMEEYFNKEAEQHDDLFVHRMGMREFYDEVETQIIKCPQKKNILVLGCGTGLEIERIHWKANVTAVDLAPKMIEAMGKKTFYPEVTLTAVCDSLLTWEYGAGRYDLVISCYVMHHFNEEQKRAIYQKIYQCLVPAGTFLCGDIMEKDPKAEQKRLSDAERIYQERRLTFASLHIDVPFCMEHEKAVLLGAGFDHITVEKEWTNTILYRAVKSE